jgi:hypothetical protein
LLVSVFTGENDVLVDESRGHGAMKSKDSASPARPAHQLSWRIAKADLQRQTWLAVTLLFGVGSLLVAEARLGVPLLKLRCRCPLSSSASSTVRTCSMF